MWISCSTNRRSVIAGAMRRPGNERKSADFSGNIPQNYDSGMGPIIFAGYGRCTANCLPRTFSFTQSVDIHLCHVVTAHVGGAMGVDALTAARPFGRSSRKTGLASMSTSISASCSDLQSASAGIRR